VKIVVERDVLLDGLQKVFNVVPQKPTLPIIANFLLRCSSDGLSISGTDMDMSVTTLVRCGVEGEGSIAVNAKRLMGIIRELPEGEVTVDIEGEKVEVGFERGSSSLMGMSPSEFPVVKDSIDGVPVSISGGDFFEMVDKTSFAVATERTRITLTGVYWRVSSDDMTMVATDGHRLSLVGRKFEGDGQVMEKVSEAIVPPKALNLSARIFAGGTGLERVVFGEGTILFDFNDTKVFSKLIEGPYPDYAQVIPTANSRKVVVGTGDLEAAVRRVSVLSNSMTHQIRFSLSPGRMEISTSNIDIGGEAREVVEVGYEGDSLLIGFNAHFLLEILRRIDTEEVLMELETPTSACILKPHSKEEKGEHLYLIMPLRLSD